MSVYTVNRKVSDFPTNENLSAPESAYAAFNRAYAAEGIAGARRLSVRRLADRMPPDKAKPVAAKIADELLNSEIVEVRLLPESDAAVIAKVPHPRKTLYDLRLFEWEEGRWLNTGQDIWDTLEGARSKFVKVHAHRAAERKLISRVPVANPGEHLRPFVEFLKLEARAPESFLLKVLEEHRLVLLGEVHNRAPYWAFNASLVRRPEFAAHVGVVYLEFPNSDQDLIDRFLASPKYDPEPVIEMLRNMFELGWPDQPTLEFCKAIWEVNQRLPAAQRVRIVLVDMARPWKSIQKRDDWRKYDVDRDELMATNIVADLRSRADGRHGLFIVGYMHAMTDLTRAGEPVKSAGWHLREKLGKTNCFSVFSHSPVMSNRGDLGGRIALGLFESAFAVLSNRPMAFPLDHGPFGAQVFDASLDLRTTDSFSRGYDAYLYLGPVESEIFSPLIPGFYTDAFATEVDRRCKLMWGKGAAETYRLPALSGENLAKMRSAFWGQPRREWSAKGLGPLNAWHLGGNWEKESIAAKRQNWRDDPEAIQRVAGRLFGAIREANYANPGPWETFPAPDVEYQVDSDYPRWVNWVCSTFGTNPIVNLQLGRCTASSDGWPCVPYTAVLKNGQKLEGVLPFHWDARAEQWYGVQGLDWHLPKRSSTGARPGEGE